MTPQVSPRYPPAFPWPMHVVPQERMYRGVKFDVERMKQKSKAPP